MPSEVPVDRWEVDGTIRQSSISHTCSIGSRTVSMLDNPYGDILRLKAFRLKMWHGGQYLPS
ncbi:hypothetical protein TNCV_4030421, partial [Trichonephila clavipes]